MQATIQVHNKILVTGGTGFFGRALLRHWGNCWQQDKAVPTVTVLTRSPETFLSAHPEFNHQPWLRFHMGDILFPESLPRQYLFTHILHAAADSTLGPCLSNFQRYRQIVDGTRNVLEFAVTCGARRFLLISSGGVYGPQPTGLEKIPESYNGMPDPLNPANAYSVAKRAAEHLCTLYGDAYGIESVVARCFSFIGQDLPLNVHFAIGNFIYDALHSEEIVIKGDGSPIRSFLDQRDLAQWLCEMLEKGQAGRAYNVGSDQAITLLDLATRVRDLLAPEKSVRVVGIRDSSGRNVYVPDIARARLELGLDVWIPLDDAIRTAVVPMRDRG